MNSPCLNCESRAEACWGTCDKFKEYEARKETIKKQSYAERKLRSDIYEIGNTGKRKRH